MSDTVRIATRKSPLALWQAEFIKAGLERAHPELEVELVAMSTRGDRWLDKPLSEVGGKGLFVKELEVAMLEGRADLAVHSMKDVPMEFPDGLELAIICEREEPRDAFVSNDYASIDQLPAGAVVGTSSLRRQCQLRQRRPDLDVRHLRGNVNTRLAKLDAGEFDAIILACAGLLRLEMNERIAQRLPVDFSLPAGGQGAVGVEIRSDDARLRQLLAHLHHEPTARCVVAERALNRRLQGGCQVPIACYAIDDPADPTQLWLRSLVGAPDGSELVHAEGRGREPEPLGLAVAEQLLALGAGRILQAVYGET